MKINFYQFLLLFSVCFLMACQSDSKQASQTSATTPAPAPAPAEVIPNSVAAPSNTSRPDKMTSNFLRMQGEWQKEDDFNQKLQVRGKVFLEIQEGANQSKLSNPFKVVKSCEGATDLDGEFFMVGNRCFKLLSISIETMEVEDLEQQRNIVYNRI